MKRRLASGRTSLRGLKKKCVNQVGKGPQGFTVLKGVSQWLKSRYCATLC
jgi:hypothetical protein